jgi:hypothetical protein
VGDFQATKRTICRSRAKISQICDVKVPYMLDIKTSIVTKNNRINLMASF